MTFEEIDFKNGQTPASEEIMKAFQTNIKNAIKSTLPVELFSGASTGAITLSENVEDFEYLEVFYRDSGGDSRNANSSTKIANPNNSYFNAKIISPVKSSSNQLRYTLTTFFVSGNQITPIDYLTGYITNSTLSYFGSQENIITKVLGYR